MIVLTAMMSIFMQPAHSWNLVDNERGRFSYDANSLRIDGGRVTVLTQYENMTLPGGPARSEAEMLIDCAGRTYAFIKGRAYDTAGTMIHSREIPVTAAVSIPIAANSSEDRLRALVCPSA